MKMLTGDALRRGTTTPGWPPVSIRYAHHPGGTTPQGSGRRQRQQEHWSGLVWSVWFSAQKGERMDD
ncbi:hypothetical protein CCHR01_18504 [Colletotrichum chrysophilum]|uniref:Uncharacterized protein n=1 Tax=Colletotrichum chrysophilum TaxID=1836956 RepID=A0AAD9A0L7_9PEZI|nr:hypothetical protein CCHR01_18504 [Colletotrichum chrysophilum]